MLLFYPRARKSGSDGRSELLPPPTKRAGTPSGKGRQERIGEENEKFGTAGGSETRARGLGILILASCPSKAVHRPPGACPQAS